MACMKCGKNTEDERMFCARCLEVMEAYPVKPDVHIQLPIRNTAAAPKKQIRKTRADTKDARIATLRLQLRLMWVVVIVLLLAVAFLLVRGGKAPEREVGQNYTYIEPTP